MAVLIGQNGFKIKIITDGTRRRLGRQEDCEIVVPDPAVSRQHLFLSSSKETEILVENAGSVAGFYVNGYPVQGYFKLKVGDRIAFGSQEYLFTLNDNESYSPALRMVPPENSQSASMSYAATAESKRVRDISPLKMVFAFFVAITVAGAYLRTLEDQSRAPASDSAQTPLMNELSAEGYQNSKNDGLKSQTEIQAESTFREALRDYYNKNYSRAIEGLNGALILNPAHEEAADFLQLAQSGLKTQLTELLKDGERSFANLQFRRSKAQSLRILTILAEQVPSYSRKIVQEVLSGRKLATTSQEDLMLNLPCDKSKEEEICKKAMKLLQDSRRSLKEEEMLK